MHNIVLACLAILALASPAAAVTNENGETLITQAEALAGNITPGDAPGFPVTISVPGVYRLASGLTVSSFVHGIDVTAAEVTIDLGGNRIIGSGVGANGINGRQRGLTVMNGTIRAFTQDGIRAIGSFLLVDNMRITDNNRYGVQEDVISTAIRTATIRGSVIIKNQVGVVCGSGCRIEDNTISQNIGTGVILSNSDSMLKGNAIERNGGFGISGGLVAAGGNSIRYNASGNISGSIQEIDPNTCEAAC